MNDDIRNLEELHPIPEQFMPYSCTELRDDQIEYARDYLNETEETRRKGLQRIKTFINKELYFFSEFDDNLLLTFLRTKSFDFEKTCDMMKNIAALLVSYQSYFTRIDTDILSRVIASRAVTLLPYRDAKGRAIIFIQAENWDPTDLKAEDMIFGSLMAFHKAIENPVTQVTGFVVIFSCKHVNFSQFTEMSSWFLFGVHNIQKCSPAKIAKIHVLHTPALCLLGWRIIEPFVFKEFRNRIKFHDSSNWESFYNHIPTSILPEEIGGQLELYSSEQWAKEIPTIRERFFDIFYKGESD